MFVTIKDVASKAGVSLSTVSLVLNNKKPVSNETRQKVLEVIESLNYHPRRIARGLASKKTGNIGFILTENHFSNAEPFYTRVFLGTEFEARKYHYYILLTTVGRTFRKTEIPRFLLEKNVDGILLAGRVPLSLIEYIRELGLPFVLIDFLPRSGPFYAVLIDNLQGTYDAVSYLIRKGHRNIAFIGGDMAHPSLDERFEGYKKALRDHQIVLQNRIIITEEEYTGFDNGYHATCSLLSRKGSFTALFAGNDAMALGSLRCFREANIPVPEKVAVVGFDDIEADTQTEPRLTTVRVFKEELGAIAVRRLTEMFEKGYIMQGKTYLPVQLILRGSTGDETQ